MALTSWIRRQFIDNASATDYIPAGLGSSATSFIAHDGTTFPDGSVGPFIITVDQGLSTEEKILIASRSGSSFTVASSGRGYGTGGAGASTHAANCSFLHTIDAQDLDEANQTVVQTLGAIAAKGDLLVGSAANTLTKLTVGATATTLQVVSGTLAYVGFGSGRSQPVGAANADGTDTTYARSDHGHLGVASFNTRQGAVTPGNADYLSVSSGGLTGATAATRFVGGTTSGAPVSGTFAVGDYVVDQSGLIWVCTVAGTPGTWVLPYPALTSAAGHLSANYTLTTSLATFLTTASLGIGTWEVKLNGLVGTSANNIGIEITTAAGTATATLEGAISTELKGVSTTWNASFSLTFIATVTVAGTLLFRAIETSTTGSSIINATTGENSYAKATGYTAVRIA